MTETTAPVPASVDWAARAAAMTDAQILHHWGIAKAVHHTESADALAAEWTKRENA